MPRGLSPASVQYVRLVDRTRDHLAFLLDNVAPQITLERSVSCLERLELLLNELQRHPDPGSVFPDVVETLGPLCARFGATILLESPHARWIEDDKPSSAHYGQPAVDVTPGEPSNRYFPLHWQKVLGSRTRVDATARHLLSSRVRSLMDSAEHRALLLSRLASALDELPNGEASAERLVECLVRKGHAPNPTTHALAARNLPKRVRAALQHSGEFSKNRKTGKWRQKRRPLKKGVGRFNGRASEGGAGDDEG